MMVAASKEEVDIYALVAETSKIEALEPQSLKEAQSQPNWLLWQKAINKELATLNNAETWKLTAPPPNANIVGSKWVFHAKKDANGNVVQYKARLVTQGFSQVPGIDYFDTFALIAQLASIRTVLAVTAAEDYEIHQIDIKGAYLNGVLTPEECIYMCQLPRYSASEANGKVCLLKKTIYGLKQSRCHWYQCLIKIMVNNLKFKHCDVDQAIFYCHQGTKLVIVLVHIDDCTIVATTSTLITQLKTKLSKHVKISNLGKLHWILCIEVCRICEKQLILLS